LIDRAAASDLIEKKLYTSLDIGRTVEVENALHHPTEQGGKNIKVFALPVENNTAKKKREEMIRREIRQKGDVHIH